MRRRNIILLLLGLVFLLGIGSFFFNNYLNTEKVKDFVQAQLPENIDLQYKKLNTNVLLGNFSLEDAVIIVKDKGIKIQLDAIKLKGLNYRKLLTSDTIAISSTQIKNAFVWIDKSKIDTTKFARKPDQRNLILKLGDFDVGFSGLEFKDEQSKVRAKLNSTQIGLHDLMVQSSPRDSENQLDFGLVKIQTDSLMLPLSESQQLNVGRTYIDNKSIKLEHTQLSLADRGIQVNFDMLELNGKNLEHIFTKDTLYFDECLLTKGKIKINNSKRKTQQANKEVQSSNKVIHIQDFKMADTDLKILDERGKLKIKFVDTNASFSQIRILTSPSDNQNHLNYKFIHLDAKDFVAAMSDLHTFGFKEIQVDDKVAEFKEVHITPNYNRTEFQKHIKEEQDVLNLTVPKIVVKDYDFSFDKAHNFIAAKHVHLSSPDLSVYRNKMMPDQTARKPLYSEMLRKLKMEIAVGKIDMSDAKITYEEHLSATEKPGKIFFTQLNGSITDLYNKDKSKDLVKINLDARFMGHAPTHIEWNFNVLQPADRFRIKGYVKNLDAKSLDGFLVPNMKAKIDGEVQLTSFDFTGNDIAGKGTMDMIYEDLKVDVLNHKNEKKGFWSIIANFLVKKNKDEERKVNNIVTVERDQQKSFFNFFWLMLKDGVKQNVMKFQGKKDKE